MKISRLWLIPVMLAAVCAAVPGRAEDDEDERVEMDGDRMRGERRRGPHSGGGWRDRDEDEESGQRGMRGGRHKEMRERMRKVRELEEKVRDSARKLREAPGSGKAAAKEETKRLLGELFDLKLALHEEGLKKMEERVKEMKEKVAKRKSGREKAIESRLARLAGEEEDDW